METDKKKPRASYDCDQCPASFAYRQDLYRHRTTKHENRRFPCEVCKQSFSRKEHLRRHMKKHTINQIGGGKKQQNEQQPTANARHSDDSGDKSCDQEALGGTMRKYTIKADDKTKFDPMLFMKNRYDAVKNKLKESIKQRGALKWYLAIKVKMTRRRGQEVETVQPHFRGKCQTAMKFEDLDEGMRESIKKIYSSFIEFQRQGSNWTIDRVVDLTIHMARYRPMRGSSYIPLPIKLRNKHAIINPQNRDNKCFIYSILAALHPAKRDAERISKYKDYVAELNVDNIEFPVSLAHIPKFETQNQISVNVFGYEKGEVFPLHVTKQRYQKHVNLMMISDGKKSHYCWIKNLNRLLGDQHTHHGSYHYCPYCLQGFTKQRILDDHITYCQTHGAQKVSMPTEEDKWLHYKDIRKQLKVPYIIYADFESLQVPISEKQGLKTEKTTKHVPSGFAYKVVGLTPEHSKQVVVYRGSDATDKFVEYMVREQNDIEQKFKNVEPLCMTGSDWQNFKKATLCHICLKELGSDRVRDHCHVTGVFRGAAHNDCNINFKFTGRIPVVFHNLRGYDCHLIMQSIGKVNKDLKCIPNIMEKYISFSLGCMDFIDSFQFMPSSLETLMKNMAKDDKEKFVYMARHFGEDKLDLLLRKQVYPYEYFDSEERFSETELPPKEAFYSTLSGQNITHKDYNHAQKVWHDFSITSLGEYHDLYVVTDVLALADVFENFRNMCRNYYGLDAAHFYTSPGLAWQAALKMTGARLELFTDIDMHLFIERGLRGGISMITHRHAKANNKYVEDYKSDEPESHVMYLDANNLYGWAMSASLPTHGFQWMNEEEIQGLDVTLIPDDAKEGYVLEVDLDYPPELHDLHNDYPLAPEKLKVTDDMLSPYARQLLEDLELKGSSADKLIPNLHPKNKYILHYRNLKLYLALGMKLTKIHRVMKFQQSPWLKPYIDFNTERRKAASNEFEKDFFKLMNNSVFGKTMERLRSRIDVRLVNNQKKARKLVCKPSFQAFKIFNENLVAIHMKKEKLYLNRPIYVGFSILDISKTLMYDFHYNYIKSKYGSKAKLLFTDTDSLCYSIQTADIYEDMLQDRHLFDTSGYKSDHILFSNENKKILGKMKDETSGNPVHEFVGLKSKMYSLIYEEEVQNEDELKMVLTEKKTAKGITKSVIKHQTRHEHYKQCLFGRETHTSTLHQIRSYDHQLYNISVNKLGLSPFDDKRYLLKDGVSSLAYGHWRISEEI